MKVTDFLLAVGPICGTLLVAFGYLTHTLNARLSDLGVRLSDLNTQTIAMRGDLSAQAIAMRSDIGAELRALRAEIASLRGEIVALRVSVSAGHERIAALEARADEG